MEETRQFDEFFRRIDVSEEAAAAISERAATIVEVGDDSLRALKPLLDELGALKRSDARALMELAADAEPSGDALEQAIAVFPDFG